MPPPPQQQPPLLLPPQPLLLLPLPPLSREDLIAGISAVAAAHVRGAAWSHAVCEGKLLYFLELTATAAARGACMVAWRFMRGQ
jgi:hypothetical protein